MAAPASVIIEPGYRLLFGKAATAATVQYQCGANAEQRVRVTSIVCCDTSKSGTVTIRVQMGGLSIVHDLLLPGDGSPLPLTPNESLAGSEALIVTASVPGVVDVRATGELIFVT